MTISGIHILEALAVLLVGYKLLKIRSLYLNTKPQVQPRAASQQKNQTGQSTKSYQAANTFNPHTNSNLFLNPLPEPEVLFSSEHEEVVLTDVPGTDEFETNEKKSILNNYIDDFFYETPKFSFDENKSTRTLAAEEDSKEDEFITVQQENAELIRAMEALKREIGIPVRS